SGHLLPKGEGKNSLAHQGALLRDNAGTAQQGSRSMSRSLRIALAQLDFPVGDVAGNSARIIESIQVARDEYGADVVLFPELAISGYPPEDLLLRPAFLRDCEQALARIAAQARGIVAVVGWPQD